MTKKKTIDFRVICVGIICLTVLEVVAMCYGINGTVRTIVIALIAAAIGVTIPTPKIK